MDRIIERYCHDWGLEPWGDPLETFTSLLQPVRSPDGLALLKCFKPSSDELASGALLEWFDGSGCVRLLRGDHTAQLLEWIDGRPLSDLVREGRDSDATSILAEVAGRLHAERSGVSEGLWPLEDWMGALLERETEAAPLARRLLETTSLEQPLHGDLHHGNILHHRQRGWLAIDPKGLFGDRYYDFANALFNPIELPELVQDPQRFLAQARFLAERAALDLDRLIAFCLCYASLSEIWCEQDGVDPTHSRRMGEVIRSVRCG